MAPVGIGIGAMLEPAQTIVVLRNVERERTASLVAPVQSVKPYGAMQVSARTTAPVVSAGLRHSSKCHAGHVPIDLGATPDPA